MKRNRAFWIVAISLLAVEGGAERIWGQNVPGTIETLKENHLTPINVGGHDVWACGIDFEGTKFTAINSEGYIVEGSVCRTPFFRPKTYIQYDQ